MNSIVENPISAIINANFLGILFWAIVIGFGFKVVGDTTTNHVIEKFTEVLSNVISGIIQFAPIGILGVVFTAVSIMYLELAVMPATWYNSC